MSIRDTIEQPFASPRSMLDNDGQVIDKIRMHLDARYVCAPEAMHHILGFSVETESDTVYRLAVHLPGYQTVLNPHVHAY